MALRVFVLLFMTFGSFAVDALSKPEQVENVLNAFHLAASEADGERYFALMDDEGIFIGTDATERWTKEQFQQYAQPYFSKGVGWTYRPRSRHIVFSKDGKTAWFDELLDHDSYGICRGTGVLVMTDSGWKIIQYHLTFPLPNERVDEVMELLHQ